VRWFITVLFVTIAGFGLWLFGQYRTTSLTMWQELVSPGRLSVGHASLQGNCGACHSPIRGVEAANCIVCHANDRNLLQRQPTSFHSDVSECAPCHAEHREGVRLADRMDHAELARIGLRQLEESRRGIDNGSADRLIRWTQESGLTATALESQRDVTSLEATLDCYTCHENDDRHQRFFGTDCVSCHSTTEWTITESRHPRSDSRDCAQCHQAPPSHYMEHFKMISMQVADVRSARVNQCYLCHQTTSWNDIPRVGIYKHH
jgi:hypothetical protein